ncbi:hypothetical protein JTB14_026448 [Gonioctena quinquepunctata]|nr:hypothetical protein JTB14_026448 [Gonioctena quinquepunctata]
MEKDKEEREKRQKLKEIRKKDNENKEKGKQQMKEIVKEASPEPKTKTNNHEKGIPATNDKPKMNRREKNQGKSSDSDSDWEIERTINNRKYRTTPRSTAFHRANQASRSEFDITKAARKWPKERKKIERKHKTKKEAYHTRYSMDPVTKLYSSTIKES